MRKSEIFFDAITNIKEALIDDALDYRFTKRHIPWQRYMSMAACLALVATVGFAAAQMGIFGGGSNKSDTSNMAAPDTENQKGSAPEESVLEDSSTSSSDTGGNAGTGSAEEGKSEPMETVKFGATILEVSDTWLLVEPLEGEEILTSADRFMVSITDVDQLPELKEGYEIVITFDGFIRESYPAQITASDVMLVIEENETP